MSVNLLNGASSTVVYHLTSLGSQKCVFKVCGLWSKKKFVGLSDTLSGAAHFITIEGRQGG